MLSDADLQTFNDSCECHIRVKLKSRVSHVMIMWLTSFDLWPLKSMFPMASYHTGFPSLSSPKNPPGKHFFKTLGRQEGGERKGGRGAWGGYLRHEIIERAAMVTHFWGCPVLQNSISSNFLPELHVLIKKKRNKQFMLQTVVLTHTHTHTRVDVQVMLCICTHTTIHNGSHMSQHTHWDLASFPGSSAVYDWNLGMRLGVCYDNIHFWAFPLLSLR